MRFTSNFKFKAVTPSPDKLADFWWHDEFAVENVEIKQAERPAGTRQLCREVHY